MSASKYDLTIFDCDGTLIDTEIVYCEVDCEALAEVGHRIELRAYIDRFSGIAYEEVARQLTAEIGGEVFQRAHALIKQRLPSAFEQRLRTIDGMAELVAAVTTPKCVASTSWPETLRNHLGRVGLYDHFAPHVYSATMVARGKPAPDLFLHAAKQFGVAPERCVVVEDSVVGVTAGRAAGMTTVAFLGGGHCGPAHPKILRDAGAHAVARDAAELAALLRGDVPLA